MDSKTGSVEFTNKSSEESQILQKLKNILSENLEPKNIDLSLNNIIMTAITWQSFSRAIYYNDLYQKNN